MDTAVTVINKRPDSQTFSICLSPNSLENLGSLGLGGITSMCYQCLSYAIPINLNKYLWEISWLWGALMQCDQMIQLLSVQIIYITTPDLQICCMSVRHKCVTLWGIFRSLWGKCVTVELDTHTSTTSSMLYCHLQTFSLFISSTSPLLSVLFS